MKIDVPNLARFATADVNVVRQAFAIATPCRMGQAWLPEPETSFAPATVWTGWRGESVLVFAELVDRDIYNTATELNQRAFLMGDVLEIFLRAEGCESYVEFHVTPDNQRFQLRIPAADQQHDGQLIPGLVFTSTTWVDQRAGRWWVYTEIPVASVCDRAARPLCGQQWLFSYSRYDYTRPEPKPVISSTSPHRVPSFHRQAEWGTLRFQH